MTPYILQLVQQLTDTDKPAYREFCTYMLEKLEGDEFNGRVVFSDGATFYVSGKHKTRLWGTEDPS